MAEIGKPVEALKPVVILGPNAALTVAAWGPALLRELRYSYIFSLTGKSRAWALRLLPHGEKCRQAMRVWLRLLWERCRSAKILISQTISPSYRIRAPSPPGGEVVGACCWLPRRVAKVSIETMVDRNRLRYRLFAGCVKVVGCEREDNEASEKSVLPSNSADPTISLPDILMSMSEPRTVYGGSGPLTSTLRPCSAGTLRPGGGRRDAARFAKDRR